MSAAARTFRAFVELPGGDRVTPGFPTFEMAAISAPAQLGGLIWEEMHDGECWAWTVWQRVGEDWIPTEGGRMPVEPVRPWEVEIGEDGAPRVRREARE